MTEQYLVTWPNQVENSEGLEGRIVNSDMQPVGDELVIAPRFPGSSRASFNFCDSPQQRYTVVYGAFDNDNIYMRTVSTDGQDISSEYVLVTPDTDWKYLIAVLVALDDRGEAVLVASP
jgi:hypothetical protein